LATEMVVLTTRPEELEAAAREAEAADKTSESK
jgi:hypothetical protein